MKEYRPDWSVHMAERAQIVMTQPVAQLCEQHRGRRHQAVVGVPEEDTGVQTVVEHSARVGSVLHPRVVLNLPNIYLKSSAQCTKHILITSINKYDVSLITSSNTNFNNKPPYYYGNVSKFL